MVAFIKMLLCVVVYTLFCGVTTTILFETFIWRVQ